MSQVESQKRKHLTGDQKVAALETKLQQKNEVIAELMQEHVQSKNWGATRRGKHRGK